jgi:hypothetical protein
MGNVHQLAKNLTNALDCKTQTLGTSLQNIEKDTTAVNITKWQLTVIHITSKAMQLNFWQ